MQVARSFISSSNEFRHNNSYDPNFFSLSDPNSQIRSNPFDEESSIQRFLCIVCQSPTLTCCSSCKRTFYCSTEHQTLHWKTHQFECSQHDNIISERSNDDGTPRPYVETARTEKAVQAKDEVLRQNDNIMKDEDLTEKKEYVKGKKEDTMSLESTDKSEEKYSSASLEEKESILKMQRDERNQMLKEALQCYADKKYQKAVMRAKKVYKISSTSLNDPGQTISDGLLLVKCLLNSDQMKNAREILLEVWALAKENYSDAKIVINKGDASPSKLKLSMLKPQSTNFLNDDMLSYSQKKEINKELKKKSSLFSCIASLFYSIGDLTNCEAAYVKYVKLIENNFGKESLEASNAFFLMGTFYLENKYHIKAMACFQAALHARQNHFDSKDHECIADCYYNIAVIFKQTEEIEKALMALDKVIQIRVSVIGEVSLPVAQALELKAKIHFENGNYKESFNKFQACQSIRKKVLREPKHPDILRVNTLVIELYNKIHEVINGPRNFAKQIQVQVCKTLKTQMEQSSLFGNILPKIPIHFEVQPSPIIPPSKNSLAVSRLESSKYIETPTKLSIKIPPAKPEIEKNSGSERNYILPSTQDSIDRNIRGFRERHFTDLSQKTGCFPSPDKGSSKRNSTNWDYLETNNDNVLSLREDSGSEHALDSHRLISELKNVRNMRNTLPVPEKDKESSSKMDSMTVQDYYPFRKEGPMSSFVLTSRGEIDTEN